MKSKYIVGLRMKPNFDRRLEAVIFAETMTHKEVAEDLFGDASEIIGAGFVHMDMVDGHPRFWCNGYSESLGGIQSRGDADAIYVRFALGMGEKISDEQAKKDFYEGVEIRNKARQEKLTRR